MVIQTEDKYITPSSISICFKGKILPQQLAIMRLRQGSFTLGTLNNGKGIICTLKSTL